MMYIDINCTFLIAILISCIVSCYGDSNHLLQDMTITDVPVRVYPDNFPCGPGLSGSLSELSDVVTPTGNCVVCNGKEYVNNDNFTEFYPSQHCVEVSYQCGNGTEYHYQRLLGQLGSISEFIHSYPSGCLEILQENNLAQSGFYKIRAFNGSLISVYCDMEGSNCDGVGGWMRVGYLNMSEPGATCPPGLTLRQFNNIDHGVCGRPMTSSTFYLVHGLYYSKVCGQLRGYQFYAPDGFPPLYASNASPDIDNCNTYVDGVTITYGSNPHKHIWTYACGITESNLNVIPYSCPCNINSTGTTVPIFVGIDYYCESGVSQNPNKILYTNDPLWDGQKCNGNEGPCCTNPKMPWFIKALNETTTEDIELRMCGSENPSNDEDTPLDIIELYIR